VFELLHGVDLTMDTTKGLSNIQELSSYSDILVLPVKSFETGQIHPGSDHDRTVPPDALLGAGSAIDMRPKKDIT
jgi:hypothetical protein